MNWLMGTISKNFEKYSERISADVTAQRGKEMEEKATEG